MGTLDDITLFRFAHISRSVSVGGIETYLHDLNRGLLQRNRMKIIQTYLTEERMREIEIEHIGLGEIIWVPSYYSQNRVARENNIRKLWTKVRRHIAPNRRISHSLLLSTLKKQRPDLALFHWISQDSRIVSEYLNEESIPCAVVNHFLNDRLNERYVRRQIRNDFQVGGVSGVDVPNDIRDRFFNLSDGINTDFYQMDKATPLKKKNDGYVIFMPCRVTEGKGHQDAVRVLVRLLKQGISATLVFAGSVKSLELKDQIDELVDREGIKDRVVYVGELSAEEIRNWYSTSDIVVQPSYSEGLGRVILEAQSMKKVVVAYDTGGVSEAMRHGDTGYLVKVGDIDGLARRVKQILLDKLNADAMSERGRAFVVDLYSLDSLIARHEVFYSHILRKHKNHGCPGN